jgi:hypothetical protein
VDRVVALEGVRAEIAMVQTPGGQGRLELTKFHTPSHKGGNRHAPANTPGIRHVAFAVEDIDAVGRRVASPRRGARRRAGALRGQLPALLRPRPRWLGELVEIDCVRAECLGGEQIGAGKTGLTVTLVGRAR